MTREAPAFEVEVDWNGDGLYSHALSDVTDDLEQLTCEYGARVRGNPDYPAPLPTTGRISLGGDKLRPLGVAPGGGLTRGEAASHAAIRVSLAGQVWAEGFLRDVQPTTTGGRWRIDDDVAEQLSRHIDWDQTDASGNTTAAAIIGEIETETGLSVPVDAALIAPQLGVHSCRCPAGRLIAEAARLYGALPAVTAPGTVRLLDHASQVAAVAAPSRTLRPVDAREDTDWIRNRLAGTVAGLVSTDLHVDTPNTAFNIDLEWAPADGESATKTTQITLPVHAGASIDPATVSIAVEPSVVGYCCSGTAASSFRRFRNITQQFTASAQHTPCVFTPTITSTAGGQGADMTVNLSVLGEHLPGAWLCRERNSFYPGDQWGQDCGNTGDRGNTGRVWMRARVLYRLDVQDPEVKQTIDVENDSSRDEWGIRQGSELPDWLHPTTARAHLQRLVNRTGAPRNVVKLRLPFAQDDAAQAQALANLRPGSVIRVDVVDERADVYEDMNVVAVGVSYTGKRGGILTVTAASATGRAPIVRP